MKRSSCQSIALAAAIGLWLACFAMPTAAQQQQQQQQQQSVREVQLESNNRREVELRRKRDADERAFWIEQRRARKPVVGVLLVPDEQAGVLIAGVTPNSGAAKAGLRSGDRILSIAGNEVLGSTGELRAENARKLLGKLDVKTPVKLTVMRDGKIVTATVTPTLDQSVAVMRRRAPSALRHPLPPGIDPEIRTEIIRIGPEGDCEGDNCQLPMLAEAFRWNGLNLASVDPQLGRYFGTNRGVLVLSTGPDLAGLQAGDVIHKVDGKTVNTPREAMAALRGKPAESLVAIDYLRDRKPASVRLKVPKAMPLRIPPPPTPPAPPAAPRAPLPPPPPSGTAFEYDIMLDEELPMMALAPEASLPPDAPDIVEEIEIETR